MHLRFKDSVWRFFLSMTLLSTFANGTTPVDHEYCPKGWHYYHPRERCFRLQNKGMSWDRARAQCKGHGGDLATIPDSQTNAFVRGLTRQSNDKSSYWIGLHDRVREGVFKWLDQDGATNFTYWAKRQPNSYGNEDCVVILVKQNNRWNDYPCSNTARVFCERRAESKNNILTLSPTPPTADQICPKGWHYYEQRERCFLLKYKLMSWDQARVQCKGYGGDLAKIPDSETNAFVKGLIEDPNCAEYWIGLHDRVTEGVFKWLDQDGATNFTYWAQNEPNNLGDEDCVFISGAKDRKWNDAACDAHIGFSCERRARNKNNHPTPESNKRASTTPEPESSMLKPEIYTGKFHELAPRPYKPH